MLRRHLLVPAVALLLPLTLAAPAAADMTQEQAGDVYLSAICPGNKARVRLVNAMFGKKETLRPRDMKGKRLKRTRAALRNLERIESAGATKLKNPPDIWPSDDVAYAVESMADAMLRYADATSELAQLSRRDFLIYFNEDFAWAGDETTSYSRIARAELNLSGLGGGC